MRPAVDKAGRLLIHQRIKLAESCKLDVDATEHGVVFTQGNF